MKLALTKRCPGFAVSAVAMPMAIAMAAAGIIALPRTAAAQSSNVGFDIEVNHVGISVANLEESVEWYVDKLGFELVNPINRNPNSNSTIARLRRGNFDIELFEFADSAPLPEYRRDPTADLRVQGLVHFAFRVDDARAVLAELQAKGVEIVFGPNESDNSIFFFVSDNSGNAFEFIEFK